MRNAKLASLMAGVALALLAGCSTTYNPPQERVAVVAPPVVVAAPSGAQQQGSSANAQTFQTTIGMTPLESQGIMRLQSFAGDVCVQDNSGKAQISHCICQQTNCNCQTTGDICNP